MACRWSLALGCWLLQAKKSWFDWSANNSLSVPASTSTGIAVRASNILTPPSSSNRGRWVALHNACTRFGMVPHPSFWRGRLIGRMDGCMGCMGSSGTLRMEYRLYSALLLQPVHRRLAGTATKLAFLHMGAALVESRSSSRILNVEFLESSLPGKEIHTCTHRQCIIFT